MQLSFNGYQLPNSHTDESGAHLNLTVVSGWQTMNIVWKSFVEEFGSHFQIIL